jgi:hypothetical protein
MLGFFRLDIMLTFNECNIVMSWQAKYQSKVEGKKGLKELDEWILQECSRHDEDPSYRMKKKDVERIMAWKLKRGKFRPRLQGLVASNSEDMVDLRGSGGSVEGIQRAIGSLSELKGVGVATASGTTTSINVSNWNGDECTSAVHVRRGI